MHNAIPFPGVGREGERWHTLSISRCGPGGRAYISSHTFPHTFPGVGREGERWYILSPLGLNKNPQKPWEGARVDNDAMLRRLLGVAGILIAQSLVGAAV